MINLYVMFADDEPDIREIIDISLALDPLFVLRGCASGDEALATAAEWRPDLILLDVMMPVLDGPMTLEHLRRNRSTAAIPVVFMTARTQAREVERFKSLGAVGVIAKPFDPMALASEVRHFVPAEGPLLSVRADFLLRLRSDATRSPLAARASRKRQARRRCGVFRRSHTLLPAPAESMALPASVANPWRSRTRPAARLKAMPPS
jgi:CheY-like chemotaxis protein